MALERSPEFLALKTLLLSIRFFDQLITFLYNYLESGTMDQMLCKEFYFSSGGCFVQQSRTGWAILSGSYKKLFL